MSEATATPTGMHRAGSEARLPVVLDLQIPSSISMCPSDVKMSRTILGEGGFGKVVAAELLTRTDPRTSQPTHVAVKIMNKIQVSRSSFSSLQAEVNICAKLSHPCIINTFGIFQDVDSIYIVMDVAEGGELLKYMKRVGLEDMPQVAPNFIGEVILGLEYFRKEGVLHRDLKPENLLLTADFHVKIADFGTACRADDLQGASKFTGTAFYVSPEVLGGQRATFASDLWAVGCIIYQLYVGRPPFAGETQYMVMQAIKERKLEFPPGDYFPPLARDLVEKMLQLDPVTRLGAADLNDVKAHPFFQKVVWDKLLTTSNVTHLNRDHTKEWEGYLLDGEIVVYSSKVVKERYVLVPSSAKTRLLVLTDYPRLFYVKPESRKIKGVIPWSDDVFATAEGEETFNVHTPGRVYEFVDAEKHAPIWAAKINDLVKRKKGK